MTSMELRFFFPAHPLMRKISKGHNSVKNVDGIRFLVFCTSSDDGLY